MIEALRKPVAAALLLLFLLLLCSSGLAASGGRMGGRLRSSPPPPAAKSSYRSPSPPPPTSYRSPSPPPSPRYRYRSSYHNDEVSDLKYQVSDLKYKVSGLKRDLNKVSDLKTDHDKASDFKKGPEKVFDLKKNTSRSIHDDKASDDKQFYHVLLFATATFFIATLSWLAVRYYTGRSETSVLKLQFGLLGLMRVLQKDLNQIAETADTDTEDGLKSVLTETTDVLFRQVYSRKNIYALYGHSSVKSSTASNWEEKFNKLSDEERLKFDKETLVNLNNKLNKRSFTKSSRTSFGSNEFIVVTVLVAAKGKYTLPFVGNTEDLKEALQKLASIPSTRLKGVEVLWTPQEENDTLTDLEFWKDYPLLQLLCS